jgi:DNA polymerase-4
MVAAFPVSPADTPSSALNWLFVDLDSFFASAEKHLRPELRGRAVGIVPVESDGSCIIAACREAKRHGVRTGTRVREARRLCPRIALVKARPQTYVRLHHAVAACIERCAPIHRMYSIDEWAVRLLGTQRTPEGATDLARRIKAEILAAFSPWLTCSIGLAPSRLLAKIGSDMRKPDGLVTLSLADLPALLEPLALTDLPGIADGMLRRLHDAGVHTTRQLWDLSRHEMRHIWNSVLGASWWDGLHGIDRPEPSTRRRTMTHANMLAPQFRHDDGAHAILVRLLCRGAARLRRHGYVAHGLQITARSYHARAWAVEARLPGSQDTITILRRFEDLWAARPWAPHPHATARPPQARSGHAGQRDGWMPLAQVSMTLTGLESTGSAPAPLFPQEENLRRLSQAIDRLNSRWGDQTLYFGSLHACRQPMDEKIAFGRVPEVVNRSRRP